MIVVARGDRLLGAIALGDALRADTVDTISRLHELGIRTAMLTGDNKRTATHIAKRAGIDDVYAGVLPDQKAERLRDMQHNVRLAMVGDGINDAPALMQADIGIAMGSGTDIAIDAADIIILNGQLGAVITAWQISRWGYRKMLQNVGLAFFVQRHRYSAGSHGPDLPGVGHGRHGGQRDRDLRQLAVAAANDVFRCGGECGRLNEKARRLSILTWSRANESGTTSVVA